MSDRDAAQTQATGNPVSSLVLWHDPKLVADFEASFRQFLYPQLSRMPYLCKGMVRTAVADLVARYIAPHIARLVMWCYSDGWRLGYQAGYRDAQFFKDSDA